MGKDLITKSKSAMRFPKKVYTQSELQIVNDLINRGFKHRLHVSGSQTFKAKVEEALKLVKEAGYYDFLRTYIRIIREINGLSQLREAEAVIWANIYAVEEHVDAACFLVQKAWQMKNYIEQTNTHSPQAQMLVERELSRFLKKLLKRSKNPDIKETCEKRMLIQKESVFY